MTANPDRFGFCDGLFDRPCESPWKDFLRQHKYVRGWMRGEEARKRVLV